MNITVDFEGAVWMDDKLKEIGVDMNNNKQIIKRILKPAAKDVVKKMRIMAPILTSAPSFNVYRTPKISNKMKAPKGMGKIYVKIKKGQLAQSINWFQTPASKKAPAINIGPRYKRGVWRKPDKGGWYMHMVQFGTDFVESQPFVLPALMASVNKVSSTMKRGAKKMLVSSVAKRGQGKIEVK